MAWITCPRIGPRNPHQGLTPFLGFASAGALRREERVYACGAIWNNGGNHVLANWFMEPARLGLRAEVRVYRSDGLDPQDRVRWDGHHGEIDRRHNRLPEPGD